MESNVRISVIVPLYKCKSYLAELNRRLAITLGCITDDFEVVYINDGSPEQDWKEVHYWASQDPRVKGIDLSRNFGQHYAITAGLEAASGEWIVVMDGDLQDRPEEIERLFSKAREGYDIVLAVRSERQDSWVKKMSSRLFYSVFSFLTDTEQDASIANFGIYHRKVIKAILSMNDSIRYFPTMVQWTGFRRLKLPVEHAKRENGKSSYNWRSLFKLALNNIVAFSDKPLRLTVAFGFFLTAASLLFGIVVLGRYLIGEIVVPGYASIVISIWFLGGLIIAILGTVGIYVGKVFERVKDRPVYIISEKINF